MELNITAAVAAFIQQVPDVLLRYGHTLWTLLVVFAGGAVCLKLVNAAVGALEAQQKSPTQFTSMMRAALRWMIIIVTLMIALQQVGVNIASLWGVISALVAMVAIGFVALWSVLSNLLCTVVLVLMRPFEIGDEIEIIDPAMTSGISGQVKNINFVFTTLKAGGADSSDGDALFVPNNFFFQKVLRRHSGRRTYGLDRQLFEHRSLLQREQDADTSCNR